MALVGGILVGHCVSFKLIIATTSILLIPLGGLVRDNGGKFARNPGTSCAFNKSMN